MEETPRVSDAWRRTALQEIEDLQDAVLGAGLAATQLSPGSVKGSLAFATSDEVVYSSGFLDGRVALTGPLSETQVTLGLGINLEPGSRQWLNEVKTGVIGVFLPGDEHNALYMPGSAYVCATASRDGLEELAAEMELVLDARVLGPTGISPREVSKGALALLRRGFKAVHGKEEGTPPSSVLGRLMLESTIKSIARKPYVVSGGREPAKYGKVVSRALEYIVANLDMPLTVRSIANSAATTQATIYRAFHQVFRTTPQDYVRILRLHRIRHDLASESEARCTIAMIANRWGISELGRMAGRYCELFGELPSQTRARNAGRSKTFLVDG